MGCKKLSYYPQESFSENEAQIIWRVEKKEVGGQKIRKDYYAFGSVARRANTPNAYFESSDATAAGTDSKAFGQYYR
jgi:hypothetical protein